MKLHIGCGNKYIPGFKHLDIMTYDHIDYNLNADKLDIFTNNSVEEIYACHILEHFNRNYIETVLKEWHRVLEINGVLRIAVPDFDAIVEEYQTTKNIGDILGLLYGGQNYEFNFHHIVFNFRSLYDMLSKIGFYAIQKYDWRNFLPDNYQDYSRAYLPHMNINGRLMSLNLISRKI